MSRLDTIAVALIALALIFLALASANIFMYALLLGAIPCAFYAWRTEQRDLFIVISLMPGLGLLEGMVLNQIRRLTPQTIDGTLAQLDHGIGVAVWHWCEARPACWLLLFVVYISLPLAMLAGLTFTERRSEQVRAYILSVILGLLGYYLFPAVGPKLVPVAATAPRNCMPSLHLAWAMFAFIYADERLRIPLGIFAALTAVATVGLGEHYAVDLVAALPFTALVYRLGCDYATRDAEVVALH